MLKAPTSQLQQIYHIPFVMSNDTQLLQNEGYDYLLDLSVLRGKLPNVKSLTLDLFHEFHHLAHDRFLRVLDFLDYLERLVLCNFGAMEMSLLQKSLTSANFSNLQDIVLLFLEDSSGQVDSFYDSLAACSLPKLRSIELFGSG